MLRQGMRPGYAAEDSAGLHFIGPELNRVVASRPAARGYRLDATEEGVVEMRLATTYLGDQPRSARLAGATSSTLSASSAA